jgi:hypothetical protein
MSTGTNVTDYLKIATYGKWNTQKTRQVGRLIDKFGADKVWIISADKGLNTIAGKFDVEKRREVNGSDEAKAKILGLVKAFANNEDRDVWAVIDGASRIFGWIAYKMLDESDEYATLLASGTPHAGVPDHLKPYKRFANSDGAIDNQKVYGPIGTDIIMLINSCMQMNANVYMTLGEDETTVDRKSGPPFVPDIPGKVGLKELMRSFDFILRMVLKDGKPMAQCDPNKVGLYWSRTRDNRDNTGTIPGEIENFDLADFVERIRGKGWQQSIK